MNINLLLEKKIHLYKKKIYKKIYNYIFIQINIFRELYKCQLNQF